MTMHVVCLDGTDQTREQAHPTNVALIFEALGGTVVDTGHGSFETTAPGLTGKYLSGVGTVGNVVLQFLGKAFGNGIAERIVRGYTFLSRNYAPGDEIYIVGFSRGATAARALAGFVVGQGLLDPSRYDTDDKDKAYLRAIAAWYAYRDHDRSLANQARLGLLSIETGHMPPMISAADYLAVPHVRAVGVFDTVSSLGLPHVDVNGDAIFDFKICDTVLSDKVMNGFHALAADEVRDLFGPTYWTPRAMIEQVIFPGAHSNVGGGYPERGLSDGALAWMLDRLGSVGFPCDRARILPAIAANALDIARDDSLVGILKDTPKRPREFPQSALAHLSIGQRWDKMTQVLPGEAPVAYRSTGTYPGGKPIHP